MFSLEEFTASWIVELGKMNKTPTDINSLEKFAGQKEH
jgi:hypothetical protein